MDQILNDETSRKNSAIRKKVIVMIAISALIWIGLLIYFISGRNTETPSNNSSSSSPVVKNDKAHPTAAIASPEENSWHNEDFKVVVNDVDIGGGFADYISGKNGCLYAVEDLGTGKATSAFRKCGSSEISVSVGSGKVCSSSYQKDDSSSGKCLVSIKAVDKAGNESDWKGRIFNIDLVKPEVSKISLDQNLELNKSYNFQANISDNKKITGCWLYVDGKITGAKTRTNPASCEDGVVCAVSADYSFDKEGEYIVRFACSDPAGNLGIGEAATIKAVINHKPVISYCRVQPVQGVTHTEFKFQVSANDPDGDRVSYLWTFGDGQSSTDESPAHYYASVGSFEPRVVVDDGHGEKVECSTASVVVK